MRRPLRQPRAAEGVLEAELEPRAIAGQPLHVQVGRAVEGVGVVRVHGERACVGHLGVLEVAEGRERGGAVVQRRDEARRAAQGLFGAGERARGISLVV